MGFHRKLVVQTNEAFSSSHKGAIQSMCNNLELITRWLIRFSDEGKQWKLLTTVVEIIVGLWCNYCGRWACGMGRLKIDLVSQLWIAFLVIICTEKNAKWLDITATCVPFQSFFSPSIFKASEKKNRTTECEKSTRKGESPRPKSITSRLFLKGL